MKLINIYLTSKIYSYSTSEIFFSSTKTIETSEWEIMNSTALAPIKLTRSKNDKSAS